MPALRSTRMNLLAGLRRGKTGEPGAIPPRSAFIVGQVALSLTLLVVSSLCLRSQMRIVGLDLGFDLDHGIVTRFNVEPVRGPLEARLAFADRVVERIEQIPQVQSAAVTGLVPLGGDALVAAFHPAGRSDIPGTRAVDAQRRPALFRDARDSGVAGAGVRSGGSRWHAGGGDREPDVREHVLSRPARARPARGDWRRIRRRDRRHRRATARSTRSARRRSRSSSIRSRSARDGSRSSRGRQEIRPPWCRRSMRRSARLTRRRASRSRH